MEQARERTEKERERERDSERKRDNQCAVKINNQRTEYFTQGRGVKQGCCISPALFNLNELADQLDRSAAPGLTLLDTEIKYLLYADDLILLSPTRDGLQHNLSILEQYCHNNSISRKLKLWAFKKKPDVLKPNTILLWITPKLYLPWSDHICIREFQ